MNLTKLKRIIELYKRDFNEIHDKEIYKWEAVMEHLAKQGYIVGAISSLGPSYQRLKFDLPSVKAQETDMRMALKYLIDQPYVDANKIGVIGFSYGALPAVRIATKNLN